MPSVTRSVDVAASPQAVWDVIADPTRHTEIGTFVTDVTVVTPGPVAVGTVYRETSGPGLLKSKSEWRVTGFDPPSRLVHETEDRLMRAVFAWELAGVGPSETRVSQTGDFVMLPRVRPLGRLLEVVFGEALLRRETDRMLADIKRLAEGGGAPRSSDPR